MELPVWLLWCIALMLAAMPAAVIPMAMMVAGDSPEEQRADEVWDASDGIIVVDMDEVELLVLAKMLADVQMRSYWGKDIDCIV